ncbi:WXG100 family type VII secretion target [Micromonospora sp. NPDC049204]|uniref:WXG100 family type VII secretion target n=1 Tax=unclassified Micromonospora TaxID=2617518 RepID=UPI0033F4E282
MATPYHADHATLRVAADRVRATHDDLGSELRRVGGAVDELAETWSGAGASKYQDLVRRWRHDVERLLEELHVMAEMLDRSAAGQQDSDEGELTALRRVVDALNPPPEAES